MGKTNPKSKIQNPKSQVPFIINQKRPYRIYIEDGPSGAMAHVAELPGCFAVGSTAPLAVAAAPRAIMGFLAWLKSHREPLVPEASISRPTMNDLSIAESRNTGAPTHAGNRAALFDFDREAWDDYKLERTLRWLSYSRADLLLKIDGLTERDLKTRQVASDRTLWSTLWHVANAEYGYINSIAGPLDTLEDITDSQPSDIHERLTAIREILLRHARAIPPDQRARIVEPTWTDRPNEPWTLPKALRRALEHELEHLREL